MRKKPCNRSQIRSEIIKKKQGHTDQALELLLDGKEISQININYFIPELKSHHLSSLICEIRNNRLVPVNSAWNDDGVKSYWMTGSSISDYLDADARLNQLEQESFNVQRKRLERASISAMRLAIAVNDCEDIAAEFTFLKQVLPTLTEAVSRANAKISLRFSVNDSQAQEECVSSINAPTNGGDDA